MKRDLEFSEFAASVQKQYLLADLARLHLETSSRIYIRFVSAGSFKKAVLRSWYRFFGPVWCRTVFAKVNSEAVLCLMLQQYSLMHLSVFYALLYSALEGWLEGGFAHKSLDTLLADTEKLEKLKRFRNGVFHVQSRLFSKKVLTFLEDSGAETWAKAVHKGLGISLSEHPQLRYFYNDWPRVLDGGEAF